jgi:hypothetical protein
MFGDINSFTANMIDSGESLDYFVNLTTGTAETATGIKVMLDQFVAMAANQEMPEESKSVLENLNIAVQESVLTIEGKLEKAMFNEMTKKMPFGFEDDEEDWEEEEPQ